MKRFASEITLHIEHKFTMLCDASLMISDWPIDWPFDVEPFTM